MRKCPTDIMLERYADGLPVGARLARHARTCPRCADRLRARHDDDAMLQRIRGALGSGSRIHLCDPEDAPGMPAIDGFRVIRAIAEGGMGRVYEGEQISPRRRVAIKLLSAGAAASDRRQRLFQREADALARVRHPDIAVVYSTGRTRAGEPFLAMEFIEGRTLSDHVAARGPSLADRLRLLARVARALEHAHQQGVVHRDLKPSNIMVDAHGNPRVLDFGLARISDGDSASGVTIDGRIAGTLAYMSPEQLAGTTGCVDARADIYSLGVVLYELCTGSLPIPVAGRGFAEIVDDIRAGAPLPPSERCHDLPRDLDRIVQRAMHPDLALRYQTAAAFADDLERHLGGERVHRRTRRRSGRRRTLLAMSAILAVSAGMGFHALDPLDTELDASTPQTVLGPRTPSATPAQAPTQVHRLAPMLTIYGDLADAERTHRARLEAARAAAPATTNDMRLTMSALAMIIEAQGRHEEAIPYFRESIEDVRNAPLWRLSGQLRIARCISAGGDHHRAMKMLVEVLRQTRRHPAAAQQPAVIAEVRVTMALVLVQQGRAIDALPHLAEAAATVTDATPFASWCQWRIARAYAETHAALGDDAQAARWAAEALRIEKDGVDETR